MSKKPTYAELEARIRELEAATDHKRQNSDRDIIRTLSKSFQQLANLSQDAIYLFDIDSGTFPFFNRRFLELFAIEEKGRKILSPRSVARHIHPEDVEKLRAARAHTLESGGTRGEVAYRYINPDGTARWMQDRWSVKMGSQNRAVAIEGFIRDNTSQKQAENELERSRKSSLVGSYILQGRRLTYVNPEFCRITGYSKEELIGMPPLNLVHVDYREHVRENALWMLAGERTAPYEFLVVDSQGRVKWVMETVTSVSYEGKRAVLGYFMDITKQKQVDQERRDKQKLKAILETAGAVSYELSSPLQAVLTAMNKLGDQNLAESQKEGLIAMVRKNTQRLTELSLKIQRISKYAAKDYLDGTRIIDMDTAADL